MILILSRKQSGNYFHLVYLDQEALKNDLGKEKSCNKEG